MERKLKYKMSIEGHKEVEKNINSVGGSVNSLKDSFLAVSTAVVGAVAVTKTLTSFYDAFIVQRDAVNGVDLAIQNMGKSGTLSAESLANVASELQKVSNYGDEDILAKIFNPLVMSGFEGDFKALGQTIIDVATGTGRSVESITAQFSGLISGASKEVTELARATGISQDALKGAIEGTNSSTQRAINLMELLGQKYEGTAKRAIDPMKQLSNTIGDVKEEFGRAFSPVIKSISQSAIAFLQNKDNVDSLVRSVKYLALGLTSLVSIKFSGKISEQLKTLSQSTSKAIDNVKNFTLTTNENAKVNKNYGTVLGNQSKIISESSKKMKELENALKSGTMTQGQYNNAVRQCKTRIFNASRGTEILTSKQKSLNEALSATAKSSFSGFTRTLKVIGSSTVSLIGWVSVAMTAVSMVYQLGKGFGFWGNEVKTTEQRMSDVRKEIEETSESLKTLSKNFILTSETEEISKLLSKYKELGVVVDRTKLFSPDPKVRAEEIDRIDREGKLASIQQETSALLKEKAELEKKRYNLSMKSNALNIGEKNYGEQLDDTVTRLNQVNDRLDVLRINKKNINKEDIIITPDKNKDFSALSKYYDMVKFADSSYLSWKQGVLKQESDAYKNTLIENGFSQEEAEEERIKLYKQTNMQLLQEQRAWRLEMDKATSFTYDKPKVYDGNMFDFSDNKTREMINKQINDISVYYDSVKFLDENYYGWKKQQILDEVALLSISDEQKKELSEQRIKALNEETQAYQNYYSVISAGINGAMESTLEFARITAKSNNDIAKAWYGLANAVIAELKRMVTQMVVNFVWQKALGFLSFGTSTGSGALPLGTGEGLPFSGGFASYNPINGGINPNSNIPTSGTIRSDNDMSISQLAEVIVNAINVNSIKGKITTIDRVDLARELDIVNANRSVL